jgi:hypothetical protein
MRFRTVVAVVVVLVLLPAFVFAQTKKKKKAMPAVFGTARYVYVQAEEGDAYKAGLMNEDRQAIYDVEDAVRVWNRYALTENAGEAELIFLVRKGRLASAQLGGTVGAGTTYPGQPPVTRTGGEARAELGTPDDLLEVKMRLPDGTLSAPVWQRAQPDGLDRPHVPLIQLLRDLVEKDYPQ